MVRTQIQLTEAQAERLKSLAAREGRSMADLIRSSVDAVLQGASPLSRAERRRRALSVVGRYRNGPRDLSVRHDRYLDEATRKR
jgi:hypothetical protein